MNAKNLGSSSTTMRIKIKDIKTSGVIKTPFLSENFIERVHRFKKVLFEVETTTLEQTIANFLQDQHPERELEVWESIALNYKNFIKANPKLTLEEKKEVFKMLLNSSMG